MNHDVSSLVRRGRSADNDPQSFERRSGRVQSVVRMGSEFLANSSAPVVWFRGISFVCVNPARLDDLAVALALLCPWHLDINTHVLE